MKKRFKTLFIALTLLLASFFIIEHIVLVAIAKTALKYVVAMDTHMNRVSLNPMTGCITVKGFKIYNPSGFKERVLADVPLITMDFKAKTILEHGIFFDKVAVSIKEINIIRNKENETNISKMKAFAPKDGPKEKIPFLADTYTVEIEKAKHIDHTKGEEPVVSEIDLNIEEEYVNVKKPDSIVKAIGFKLYFNGKLQNMGIKVQEIQKELKKLAEENKKLKEEFEKVTQARIEKAKQVVSEQTEKAKEAVKGAIEGVKEKAGKAKEVIKEKVEDAKEALKNENEAQDGKQ